MRTLALLLLFPLSACWHDPVPPTDEAEPDTDTKQTCRWTAVDEEGRTICGMPR